MNKLTHIIKTATPLLAMSLLSTLPTFIVMRWIGLLSPTTLAAGAIIYTTFCLFHALASAMFVPVSLYIRKESTSINSHAVGWVIKDSLIGATLLSVVLAVILTYWISLLHQIGFPNAILEVAQPYFAVLAGGMMIYLWVLVFNQFFLALAQTFILALLSGINALTYLLLAYLFMFGKGLSVSASMQGAAYAWVGSYLVNLICMIVIILCQTKFRRYFKKMTFLPLPYLKALARIAWPIAIQRGLDVAPYVILTFSLGYLPNAITALSAQQIVLQYTMLASLISFVFTQTTSLLTTRAVGLGQPHQVRPYYYGALFLSVASLSLFSLLCWLKPLPFITFFIPHPNADSAIIVKLSSVVLFMASLTKIVDAIRNLTTSALRCFHDIQKPITINLWCTGFISLPLIYFLGFTLHLGLIGMTIGLTLGITTCAGLLLVRFQCMAANLTKTQPEDHVKKRKWIFTT